MNGRIGAVIATGLLVLSICATSTCTSSETKVTPFPPSTPVTAIQPTEMPIPTSPEVIATANPPDNAEIGDEWVNPKDGSVLVYVPAGEFVMGAEAIDTDASSDERPAHRVYVDSFWIGKFPATNAQFRMFVEATGYKTDAERYGALGFGVWQDTGKGHGSHPVTHVSWNDAMAYCQWAGLRLPTEAEWEKAARGTDGRKYPWGNAWDASKCWSAESEPSKEPLPWTASLGQCNAMGSSPYGAMCMAGNVWEFCQDYYSEDYYQSHAASVARNPVGPELAEESIYVYDVPVGCRVIRGGSWAQGKSCCRTTSRRYMWAGGSDHELGFRVAYGDAPLVPEPDTLAAMLDLSDRVGLEGYQATVVATYEDQAIAMPTWLMNVARAQEHSILGRYRKALEALDQAERADESQSLIYHVRGDVYYYLALLSLLKQGSFAIQSETSELDFFPDEEAKDLLTLARDAYRQADREVHTSAQIELQSGTLVVPQISKLHQQQADRVLDGHSDQIVIQEDETVIVAIWVWRLFTDESEIAQEVMKITQKPD